ncbi:MAG: DUF881 domain-containing protein [Actinomycetota bacterium]|nr:DUF881 domain-containing protein [Actinomycetota bacterium]
MPDHEAENTATNETSSSGTRRLWTAVTGRPHRSQVIAAVLLALLGYAATVQIQLTHASNDFAGQRRQDLVELLDSLSGASDRAEQQISSLQSTRDQLESSSSGRAAAIADAQQRLNDLQILAGAIAAVGPGVTITIEDPQSSITPASLLNGIEELRDAGAEAVQVNHTVRLVQSSWIGGSPGTLTIDGHMLRPPYVIEAIGSAHTLSDAVGFPGGLADEISSLGGKVTVQEDDSVEVDALHPVDQPQYSHPTGQ